MYGRNERPTARWWSVAPSETLNSLELMTAQSIDDPLGTQSLAAPRVIFDSFSFYFFNFSEASILRIYTILSLGEGKRKALFHAHIHIRVLSPQTQIIAVFNYTDNLHWNTHPHHRKFPINKVMFASPFSIHPNNMQLSDCPASAISSRVLTNVDVCIRKRCHAFVILHKRSGSAWFHSFHIMAHLRICLIIPTQIPLNEEHGILWFSTLNS